MNPLQDLVDYNLDISSTKRLLEIVYAQQISTNITPEQQRICGYIKIIYDAILLCMKGDTSGAIALTRELTIYPNIVYQAFARRLAMEYVFALSSGLRNEATYRDNCIWVHGDEELHSNTHQKHIIYTMSFIDIFKR